MRTKLRDASAMACTTSASISDPPRRVSVPAALISVGTFRAVIDRGHLLDAVILSDAVIRVPVTLADQYQILEVVALRCFPSAPSDSPPCQGGESEGNALHQSNARHHIRHSTLHIRCSSVGTRFFHEHSLIPLPAREGPGEGNALHQSNARHYIRHSTLRIRCSSVGTRFFHEREYPHPTSPWQGEGFLSASSAPA